MRLMTYFDQYTLDQAKLEPSSSSKEFYFLTWPGADWRLLASVRTEDLAKEIFQAEAKECVSST